MHARGHSYDRIGELGEFPIFACGIYTIGYTALRPSPLGTLIGRTNSSGGAGNADYHRYTPPVTNDNEVSLVIPAHNCAATIRDCLAAVQPLVGKNRLSEIIVVDDASTDETRNIISEFDVNCIPGPGHGPGGARNVGWGAARCPLIWFVDSDCVAEPDALSILLDHLQDPTVAGAGGSYGSMTAHSLLARLIHEEIVTRHLAMPPRVNFLATFNVVYRRSVLDEVGGFDERFYKAQDAELAWRIVRAGHELAFDPRSRVKHFHPVAWTSYLGTQRQQGYWRVGLHLRHRGRAMRNSYSNWVDHLQPPLALVTLASWPMLLLPPLRWAPIVLTALLAASQVPMTVRLITRTRRVGYVAFALMGFVRAFARGVGLLSGAIAACSGAFGGDKS